MTESVAYRRSNLREALIDRALTVLQERGETALSLRELARDVGVSHAAPARHFADRNRLIEALAIEGFRQLETTLNGIASSESSAYEQAARAAHAYLGFAITKANLIDVMFRHEAGADRAVIGASAAQAFAPLLRIFERAQQEGVLRGGAGAEASATLFLATLQGLVALVGCGVVPAETAPRLLADAVPRYLDRDQRTPSEVAP